MKINLMFQAQNLDAAKPIFQTDIVVKKQTQAP